MIRPRATLPVSMALVAGLAAGWALGGLRAPAVRASAGDRSTESILTTGPIANEYNAVKKVQIAQDGLYYLDYGGGRLLAMVPGYQMSVGGVKVLGDFAERDLIADFGLPRGTTPHFLMTTGTLGALAEGWAPIYVVETTTRQVAAYRVVEQRMAGSSRPRFELLERRPLGPATLPRAG